MMILLSQGSWYIDDPIEREPVPDAEASEREIQEGLSALVSPHKASVPYRLSEE